MKNSSTATVPAKSAVALALVHQFHRRVEPLQLPARAAEPGEENPAQHAANVPPVIHTGGGETDQQVDPCNVESNSSATG